MNVIGKIFCPFLGKMRAISLRFKKKNWQNMGMNVWPSCQRAGGGAARKEIRLELPQSPSLKN